MKTFFYFHGKFESPIIIFSICPCPNRILMTFHIRRNVGQFYSPLSLWAHALRGGRANLLSVQLTFHLKNICYKSIVSDIQSHGNKVCIRFVSREQNSLQLLWETMTYFQPLPLRLKMSLFLTQKLLWICSQETKWTQTFYS